MDKDRQPRIDGGFIVFAIAILLLLYAAAPMQRALGLSGLLLTELMLFLCALIPIFILKYDIRKVFPIKLPKPRQVFGVLLLWVGTLLTGYLVSYITMYLFPEKMSELTQALGDYLTTAPILVSLFISALMPAICEETLCRGFIQYSFSSVKNKWLIIALVGILFGIFHMSLLRFMPTMILGFALAYIMYETKNIILPVIFHFTNNAFSLLLTYAAPSSTAVVDAELISSVSSMYIGIILVFCTAVPWLLIAGARLIKSKEENAQRQRKPKMYLIALLISALCFIAGIGITALSTSV